MARQITIKKIQSHGICKCGAGFVEQIEELLRWKDLKFINVKRKRDKKTGEPFLLQNLEFDACYNCQPENAY